MAPQEKRASGFQGDSEKWGSRVRTMEDNQLPNKLVLDTTPAKAKTETLDVEVEIDDKKSHTVSGEEITLHTNFGLKDEPAISLWGGEKEEGELKEKEEEEEVHSGENGVVLEQKVQSNSNEERRSNEKIINEITNNENIEGSDDHVFFNSSGESNTVQIATQTVMDELKMMEENNETEAMSDAEIREAKQEIAQENLETYVIPGMANNSTSPVKTFVLSILDQSSEKSNINSGDFVLREVESAIETNVGESFKEVESTIEVNVGENVTEEEIAALLLQENGKIEGDEEVAEIEVIEDDMLKE